MLAALAKERRAMLTLIRQLTEALVQADGMYHGHYEGDDAAMKSCGMPQWDRLAKRAIKKRKEWGGP